MRMRSRLQRLATDPGLGAREEVASLRTLPGKRRILAVVLPTDVIPLKAKRVDVTARGMSKRQAIGGRMTCVLQMERLSRVRINAHRTLSGHVDEFRRCNRPLRPITVEANRRGLDPDKRSDEGRESRHGSACRTAGNCRDRVALLHA